LSDPSGGNLHVFYRYTVPGTVIVFAFLLGLPSSIMNSNFADNSFLIAVIIGNIIVAGWTSYHAVYPILVQVLQRLKVYPEPDFMKTLSQTIQTTGRKDLNPRNVWSYFLWNKASEGVRERVKMLADYGHALYLVSFTFILFPFFYSISEQLIATTVFEQLTTSLFPSLDVITAKIVMFAATFAIGGALLYNGRRRIFSAYDIQEVLMIEKGNELQEVIKNFKAS
jgi:hypothetical protein